MSDRGRAVGIDAAKKGWVVISLSNGTFGEALLVPELAQLAEWLAPADVVAIDIPIGHVESGVRRADGLARQRLGRRASTVFAAPPPDVLAASTYEEANRLSKERFEIGISRQAWGLRASILDADSFVRASVCRVVEAHPELSFAEMAGEVVQSSKKSWNGQQTRRSLLAREGLDIPHYLGDAGSAGSDDVLDAAAVAWTARRVLEGGCSSLPNPPERGLHDNPVAIWV